MKSDYRRFERLSLSDGPCYALWEFRKSEPNLNSTVQGHFQELQQGRSGHYLSVKAQLQLSYSLDAIRNTLAELLPAW